jgi:hypothetical protein
LEQNPVKLYTETEVAARLHRRRRWLLEWLNRNPAAPDGQPLWHQVGRSRRFTGDHIVLIIDLILTQEEVGKARPSEEGCVYFIDGGDKIKIGFSRSLRTRLIKMGTDVPGGAKLLHFEPGTFKTEKILHRQFQAARLRGEWFSKTTDLLAYIEQRKSVDFDRRLFAPGRLS